MNPVIGGLGKAWAGLKKLAGLVLPVFASAGDFAGWSPAARLAVRLVVLAVVLVGLGVVNWLLKLPAVVDPPEGWEFLARAWLPLLFVLASAFCWLAAWLWGQRGPDRVETSFPDIDRAWGEAVQALDRAGISLHELPMFLVLGRPQGPEGAFFDGAELMLKVRGQPDRDDAPIRVYANREAIYVSCASASVLGRQAAILGASEFEAPAPGGGESLSQYGTNAFMSIGPTAGLDEAEGDIIARAQQAGRGVGQLHAEEIQALGRLAAARDEPESNAARSSRRGFLGDSAEVRLQEARLAHFGRLIARERRPYCPINGILLLIPVDATNTEQSASLAGQLCRRDLDAVRRSMQVRCPIFALVCDLENVPGFRELIGRLPDDQKRRRMGQRFPFIPDVDRASLPARMEDAIRWIAHRLLPAQVTTLWQVETATGQAATDALRANVRLYELLQQVRERHPRLARIIAHAVLADESQPAMLGGCYLAGTGPNPRSEQAFIPGVFRRLVESQDLVSWTPELLAREARYARWARIGLITLGGLVAASAALLVYFLRGH